MILLFSNLSLLTFLKHYVYENGYALHFFAYINASAEAFLYFQFSFLYLIFSSFIFFFFSFLFFSFLFLILYAFFLFYIILLSFLFYYRFSCTPDRMQLLFLYYLFSFCL